MQDFFGLFVSSNSACSPADQNVENGKKLKIEKMECIYRREVLLPLNWGRLGLVIFTSDTLTLSAIDHGILQRGRD